MRGDETNTRYHIDGNCTYCKNNLLSSHSGHLPRTQCTRGEILDRDLRDAGQCVAISTWRWWAVPDEEGGLLWPGVGKPKDFIPHTSQKKLYLAAKDRVM